MLNLKEIRTEQRKTISELSRLSGVSRAYITQLENDLYNNPTLDIILKLCTGLEITPNELIKEAYYRRK